MIVLELLESGDLRSYLLKLDRRLIFACMHLGNVNMPDPFADRS